MEDYRRLYLLYADLLEYPTADLPHCLEECTSLLSGICSPAGESLAEFQDWVRTASLKLVEETYTSTFDLQGVCCPYVGHYLFGDNYRRSWFMAQLNGGFREKGFNCGAELPDHVSNILRFLALDSLDEFSQVLWSEGLLPSVEKMIQTFDEDGHHPYRQLLNSLFILLQEMQIYRIANLDMEGVEHD